MNKNKVICTFGVRITPEFRFRKGLTYEIVAQEGRDVVVSDGQYEYAFDEDKFVVHFLRIDKWNVLAQVESLINHIVQVSEYDSSLEADAMKAVEHLINIRRTIKHTE